MNIYLIVKRDETGKVFEVRVSQGELLEYLKTDFMMGGIEILAVIRL